jgi:outer membrane protein insertion porin family
VALGSRAWPAAAPTSTTQAPQVRVATPAPAYGNQGPYFPPAGGVPPQQIPTSGGILDNDPILGGGSVFNDAGDEDPTRDLELRIRATETQTGRLMFGVGVNSDAGLMGNIVLDEQNFDWTRWPRNWEEIRNATAWRGAGQRLRIEAVPGTIVQRYMINFQEPYLLDTGVSLGLSAFYFDRRYRYWWENRIGGRVSLGYQFAADLTGAFSFRGEKVGVHHPFIPTPPELAAAVGDSSLYGFRAQLTHDTRDNAFLATSGHFFQISFEQVVGTYNYPRVELDIRRSFLLREHADGSGRHVFTLSGRAGYTGSNTPIYDHFFAGGFSTIRGFDFRGVSPISGGIQVGGEAMLLASAEYQFPITADGMLRGVVFCDSGTVEPTLSDWNDKYRVAPGFGLRILVPAMGPAPIALDFAFPIAVENGDREEAFSFFVGFGRS